MTYLRIAAITLVLAFAGVADAHHEHNSSEWMIVQRGALICDTVEQLREQFDKREGLIEGCGSYNPRFPFSSQFVFVEDYENELFTAKIGHFDFPPPIGNQYVLYGGVAKIVEEPVGRPI